MKKNETVISLDERQEISRRHTQKSKALFFALLGLSGVLYLIALIHL